MPDSIAGQRYLQRYLEAGLPDSPYRKHQWHHTLVIPAYRESTRLLTRLANLPAGNARTLVILVLNRPDSDPDTEANLSLRAALTALPSRDTDHTAGVIYSLNRHTDLYLHDLETLRGPTPADRGVGLVRKTGCDLALLWMSQGAISGDWICSTDADAILPADYFQQLENTAAKAVACVFPFRHTAGPEQHFDTATALYELRLCHYVLGLEYAGSPYAYHTLGSCLAVRARAYAQVRGFPQRAAAEDFYILNKLAKLGPVAKPAGHCVQLQSRPSDRVPFGTGPAVAAIAQAPQPLQSPLFYHPACFEALRGVLTVIPSLKDGSLEELQQLLQAQGLQQGLAEQSQLALETMGLDKALTHCRRQGKSSEQFLRQFHQWFDAFRSLKFIHAIRDAGWGQQSLASLEQQQPYLWPDEHTPSGDVEPLRLSVRKHWGWQD